MRISPFFVLLILSLSSLTLSAPSNFVPLPPPTFSGCITTAEKELLLDDLAKRARRLGLPKNSIACFLKHGASFQPEDIDSDEPCYDHDKFAEHMSDATKPCIVTLLGLEKPVAADENTSPYKNPADDRVATDKAATCSCDGGCHYCCVLSGVGGKDSCWATWCYSGIAARTNRCD